MLVRFHINSTVKYFKVLLLTVLARTRDVLDQREKFSPNCFDKLGARFCYTKPLCFDQRAASVSTKEHAGNHRDDKILLEGASLY